MRNHLLRWIVLGAMPVLGAAGGCASGGSPEAPNDAGGGAPKVDASGSSGSGSSSGSRSSSSSGSGSGGRDASGSSSSGSGGAEAAAPPAYHVSGPDILDASGKKHFFRGVARSSFEFNVQGENTTPSDVAAIQAWNANVVRIGLNQDFWLSDTSNSHYDSGYADNVDQYVQLVRQAGMDVILDLHWSDAGDFTKTPGQWCMADQHSLLFWQEVAAKYKGDTHVLFELYNEPHDVPWNVWLSGGSTPCTSRQNGVTSSATYNVVGMQQLYDAVRAAGAQNLVIVGGLQFAFDLSGVGQGNRLNGSNIVYATHPYNDNGKNTPSAWYTGFGFLAATDPVIATEFGDASSSTCSSANYDTSILPYFDAMGSSAPANRISWTAWAWYPGGCQYPSLITDWNTYGTTTPGAAIKASLQAFKQP